MLGSRFAVIVLAITTGVLASCSDTDQGQGSSPVGIAPAGIATLDGTHRHVLESRFVDQVFAIDVWQPIASHGPLPVVFVLDGNTSFGLASQIVVPMTYSGDLPPILVVGIGYVVQSPMEVVALRSRDLLPVPEEGFAERMSGLGFPVPEGVAPGGADAFLSFIEDELKPYIESRYPVAAGDATLVGYSYGGTFATHVLLTAPSSFHRYVIGSPVLRRPGMDLIRDEQRFAANRERLDATVFMSAAEFEVENRILPLTRQLMKALSGRSYDGFTFRSHEFPGETHESAIAPTISRGLRSVFGTWEAPRP